VKKKVFIISVSVFIAILGVFYFSSFIINENTSCPFCNEKIINFQKYYEDEKIVGLYNYRPLVKGHCLIVPKRHIQRLDELNKIEINQIFDLINKTHVAMENIYGIKNYMILQKNGKSVGQTVNHVHFHYIPNNKKGSNFSFLFRFLLYPFKSKIKENEMRQITHLISEKI